MLYTTADSMADPTGFEWILPIEIASDRHAFRHLWRWEASSGDGRHWVIPFASEEEYDAFSDSHDGAYWSSLPGGFSAAMGCYPDGYTPPPPRRLPIYGETPKDSLVRELVDDWNFGRWLCSTKKNHRCYGELIEIMDHDFDPSNANIDDCFRKKHPNPRYKYDEDDYSAWFESEEGDYEAFCEQADSSAVEWLGAQLKKRGHKIRIEKDIWHQCTPIIPPIDPWPNVPGVYIVAANDRVKIGKASKVINRLRELQTSAPFKLQLLAVVPGGLKEEGELHHRFHHLRLHGEWFQMNHELIQFVAEARRTA